MTSMALAWPALGWAKTGTKTAENTIAAIAPVRKRREKMPMEGR